MASAIRTKSVTIVFKLHQPAGVIPFRTKLAWGAPAFATSSLTFLISVYLTDFYVSLVRDMMHCLLHELIKVENWRHGIPAGSIFLKVHGLRFAEGLYGRPNASVLSINEDGMDMHGFVMFRVMHAIASMPAGEV